MMHGERTWLFAGMLLGFAAALVVFGVSYRTSTVQPVPIAQTMQEPSVPTAGAPPVVQLTTSEEENIGLRIGTVRRNAVSREIVTLGRVEELGAAVHPVSSGIGGRIDRVLVNIGQSVAKRNPVALIYSPELVTAAEDYRSAIKNRQQLAGTQQAEVLAQANALVEAARRRLEMRGVSSDTIKDILDSPETTIQATIYSESAGLVRSVNVTEGRFVSAGEVLLVLADLNTVLVKVDIFESDIGHIRPGLRATISSDALPGMALSGAVTFIDSRSDPQTGTTPVRIQVQNPGMRLRPGMFVRSVLQVPLGSNVLAVPRTAVIDTGMDTIVYLALDGGIFQRRSIKVGAPGKDEYPVMEGLVEGDKVVTNGAFLIDSQARLTGGTTSLSGSATPSGPAGDAYRFTFRISPEPPAPGKDSRAHVTVLDSSGKPVSDAQVRITAVMPAMPSMGMPEMRHNADLLWAGSEYVGPIGVSMAGSWNVVVEARRTNQLLATYRTRFDAH